MAGFLLILVTFAKLDHLRSIQEILDIAMHDLDILLIAMLLTTLLSPMVAPAPLTLRVLLLLLLEFSIGRLRLVESVHLLLLPSVVLLSL